MSVSRQTSAELDRKLKESNGLGISWLIGLLVYAIIAANNPEKFPGDTEWYLATPFLLASYYYHIKISFLQRELQLRQELREMGKEAT